MSIINTIYLHRIPDTIDAVLTVQAFDTEKPGEPPKKLFDRLPFRTGQWSLRHTDGWVHNGPIPKGDWWLWADIELQPGQYHPKGREIGAFHNISSDKSQRQYIINPKEPRLKRDTIGCHFENDYVGSLGCAVGLWDTPEREHNLIAYTKWIESQKALKWIQFRVI